MRVVDIDIPATILAIAALATAVGVPAWVNTSRSRKAVQAAKDATAEVIAAVRPTNGSDTLAVEIKEHFDGVKTLLDAQSKTLEVVVARQHEQSKAFDDYRTNHETNHAPKRRRPK